ncbi:hypothetical protein Anapl_16361 [Anas platyrhynchos]|uniref:Uncharacterized protein n=1 Tax=Anas platyrhynchos TaxID=8839 RepID=R0LW72_ANAPL|nr:hypothetical protein Anapl_16361 [Anas platyrhynchos]
MVTDLMMEERTFLITANSNVVPNGLSGTGTQIVLALVKHPICMLIFGTGNEQTELYSPNIPEECKVFLARSCGVAVLCQIPVQSGLKASLISLNMLLSGQEVVFPWYKDNPLA